MAEQELWTELLKQMHRRYGAVNEVFRVTKEIADALSRDDRVAAQMLLGMRQEEIDHLLESEEKIYMLLECAGPWSAGVFWLCLRENGKLRRKPPLRKRRSGR